MLRILGHNYRLNISDDEKMGSSMGRMHFARALIDIKPQPIMTQAQQESTILHEAIEVFNVALALNLEHDMIDKLETAMYAFLADNGVDLSVLLGLVDEG